MSQLRHILIIYFFCAYQTANSEEDPSTLKPDVANFKFSHKNGALLVKMSVEKAACPATPRPLPPGLRNPEEGLKFRGNSKKNPAKFCAYVDDNGIKFITDLMNVSMKVQCDIDKKTTCLIGRNKIEEIDINSAAITLGDQLWLSQTTFDVQSLYNKIDSDTGTDIPQISHLLSTSYKVSQTIKYFYSHVKSDGNTTATTEDMKIKSLQALLWNDHLVGSEITKKMPMQFKTISPEAEPCWEASTSSNWICIYIKFETNSNNRLPIKDFYLENLRALTGITEQNIFFELHELCFYYT